MSENVTVGRVHDEGVGVEILRGGGGMLDTELVASIAQQMMVSGNSVDVD
jgi:hypothetical protein